MNNGMYESPKSDLAVAVNFKPSPYKAIFFGAFIDIGGTLVLGIVLGIFYGLFLSFNGYTENEIMNKMTNINIFSAMGMLSILLGLSISVYAGVYCAWKSVVNIYRNTTIMSVISGVSAFLLGLNQSSLAESAILTVLSVLSIFLGAFWGSKRYA